MILVNFKLYKESFGEGAVKLAEICKKIAKKQQIEIVPVVAALDVYRIYKEVGIQPYIQHVDADFEGAKTGRVSPLQAMALGARGALINHSEDRIKPGTVRKLLKLWPKKFESILCLQTWGQVPGWAGNLRPTMVAYEPKYLIGSRDKSVASEKPEMIKKMADLFGSIPLLAGAGVHSRGDVQIAVRMGAAGILVATDVVKAVDPEKELTELASGFSV